jgi:hypothetical protein
LRLSNTRIGLGDIHYGSKKTLTTINQSMGQEELGTKKKESESRIQVSALLFFFPDT